MAVSWRARPPPPHARLLDLWPRGRPDAVPGRRSPPTRLGAAPDAPDPGLVRLHDRVPAGAGGRRLVVPRADLGAGADAESRCGAGSPPCRTGRWIHDPSPDSETATRSARRRPSGSRSRAGARRAWTRGPRSDERRLRELTAELGWRCGSRRRGGAVAAGPPHRGRRSRIDRWIAYANSVVEEVTGGTSDAGRLVNLSKADTRTGSYGSPIVTDRRRSERMRPCIAMRVAISLMTLVSLSPLSEAPSSAQEPDTSVARGRALFLEKGCAQCHRVGTVGASIRPDLHHAGARYREGDLTRWLTVSPEPSPGARVRELDPSQSAVTRVPRHMPTLVLSEQDARALAAYLSSLP